MAPTYGMMNMLDLKINTQSQCVHCAKPAVNMVSLVNTMESLEETPGSVCVTQNYTAVMTVVSAGSVRRLCG